MRFARPSALLDTHLLIWIAAASPRLPPHIAAMFEGPDHGLAFSAASVWEVAIKATLRRPDFHVDPIGLRSGLLAAGCEEIPVTGLHGAAVAGLPRLHGDPFDRLMIAQARIEGLPFLTADAPLAAYGPPVEVV